MDFLSDELGNYLFFFLIFAWAVYDIFIVDFLHRRNVPKDLSLPPSRNVLGTGLIGRFVMLMDLALHRNQWYEYIRTTGISYKHGVFRIHALGKPEIFTVINPEDTVNVLKTNFDKYEKGPVFKMILGDFLGHGIFASDGIQWKNQRRAASQMFKTRLMQSSSEVIAAHSEAVVKILDLAATEDRTVDLQDLWARFTLDCFFEIAFRQNLDCLHNETSFHRSLDIVIDYTERRTVNPFYPHIDFHREIVSKNLGIVNELAYSLIRKRRKMIDGGEVPDGKDVLSYFLTKDDDGNVLNDEELRDAVINFILAGRDTTTQLLTWTCFLLSQNPEIEEKMIRSIVDEIPAGKRVTRDDVKPLHYVKAVLDEALRLYPSVPIDYKQCVEADVLPCSGYYVPKGTMIMWSAYAMGRWTDLWKDPMCFNPERWMDPSHPVPPQNHLPFQIGPRVCLGMNFAYMEAQIAVATVYRQFTFTHPPDHKVELSTGLTPRAKYGMIMNVHRRI